MKLVARIEQFKNVFRISYEVIFDMISLCSGTYRRWKNRVNKGVDPVIKPGPRPVFPLDNVFWNQG